MYQAKIFFTINQPATILVTGATGFLGAYIAEALVQRGFQVRGLQRPGSRIPPWMDAKVAGAIQWATGDITDIVSLEDAMAGADAVVHAAGLVSFSPRDYRHLHKINVEGTANVVNVALETGVKRIVHISSVAALGRSKENQAVDENTKWEDSKLNTRYAITKHKGELEVWRGLEEGLSGVILNPSTILGYGNWEHGSAALFKNIYDEYGWYSEGINGFTDVADVAAAAAALLQSTITEERFIINAENISFKDLFFMMADGLGKKRPSKKVTPGVAGMAWRLAKVKSWVSGRAPLITRESAAIAQSVTHYDNTKLLKALPGFTYRPLEESIKTIAARYRAAQETQHA